MKFSRFLVLLVLVGLTASAAMADGIDPTVVIRQVDPPPTPITDPFQTFGVFAMGTANNGGVVDVAFQNQTGLTLVSLSLTLIGLNAPLDFSFGENAGGDIFANTQLIQNGNGSFTLIFSGVDDSHTGLLPAVCNTGGIETLANSYCQQCIGGIYSIEIAGIPTGAIVAGAATVSAPEPATLMLMSAGLVGLAAFRKRRAVLQN